MRDIERICLSFWFIIRQMLCLNIKWLKLRVIVHFTRTFEIHKIKMKIFSEKKNTNIYYFISFPALVYKIYSFKYDNGIANFINNPHTHTYTLKQRQIINSCVHLYVMHQIYRTWKCHYFITPSTYIQFVIFSVPKEIRLY